MTRKRFIKLLMAHKIQRNKAEEMARAVEQYGSYKALYQKLAPALTFLEAQKGIVKAYNHLAKQIKVVATALVDNLRPIIKNMIEQHKERQEQECSAKAQE